MQGKTIFFAEPHQDLQSTDNQPQIGLGQLGRTAVFQCPSGKLLQKGFYNSQCKSTFLHSDFLLHGHVGQQITIFLFKYTYMCIYCIYIHTFTLLFFRLSKFLAFLTGCIFFSGFFTTSLHLPEDVCFAKILYSAFHLALQNLTNLLSDLSQMLYMLLSSC